MGHHPVANAPALRSGAVCGMRAVGGGLRPDSRRPSRESVPGRPSLRCARARPGPGSLRARRPAAAAPRRRAAARPCRGRAAPLAPSAGVRLAVCGPALRGSAGCVPRPCPAPGGPCARLRRRRFPACALRAASRPGSSRPAGYGPLRGPFTPRPPGVWGGCVCVPGAVGDAWNPLRRKKKRLSQSGKTCLTYRQEILDMERVLC